jgi:uncharacterized membrane protein
MTSHEWKDNNEINLMVRNKLFKTKYTYLNSCQYLKAFVDRWSEKKKEIFLDEDPEEIKIVFLIFRKKHDEVPQEYKYIYHKVISQ